MEDWITFYRLDGPDEIVFAVNRALLDGRAGTFPFHAAVTFSFPAGISPNEAPILYYAFEASVLRKARSPAPQLIGTRTAKHIRTAWFCSNDRSLVKRLGALADKTPELKISVSEAGPADLRQLIPSDIELQLMRDIQGVLELQQQGDDLSHERVINHSILHVPDDARLSLLGELETLGYAVEDVEDGSIQFKRKDPMDLTTIHARTKELYELCQNFGCSYDGWACPVIN